MRTLLTAIGLTIASWGIAFDATIPVLHLPDYYNEETKQEFLQQLEQASHDVGFFALTGTGVDVDMLDKAYGLNREYFGLEFEEKMELLTKNGQRGYIPSESAKEEKRMDFKEFYHIGRELNAEDLSRLQSEPNVWPERPEGFREGMIALFSAMDECKDAIGEAFSEVLGMDKGYLNEMTREGECLMRTIHYPANPPQDAIWAGAHTDIDLFTILPRSTARGLQIYNRAEEWIDVIVPDDAFVINCADMLENLTNGYFRSSYHRVVDPGLGQERFSIVFFVHPRAFDRLDPLQGFIEKTGGTRQYANVTRLELLAERLIDLGLASHELMEFFVESGAIERLREVGRFSPKAEAALLEAGFSI